MVELLRNRHFLVQRVPGSPMVEVRRTPEPFGSIGEMRQAFAEVAEVLDGAGRISLTLLVDTRDAPARNDPAFESEFEPLRIAMLSGFRRVGILVRTSAGRMQVERHAKEDGSNARAFLEESEARLYCLHTK